MERGVLFWGVLGVILVTAFALRCGAAVWWQNRLAPNQPFAFPDSDTYWHLGRTIVRGEPYQYGDNTLRVFRTPGYPGILAALFVFVGDDPPKLYARLLGALFGTATVAAISLLAGQLFGERAALVAAAIAACEPLTVGTSVFILTECPFGLFMLLQLAALVEAERSETAGRRTFLGILAGIAAGIATLIRPSWLLFTPLVGLLGTVFTRDRTKMFLLAITTQAALMFTMSPWWIRNWYETGRYVPTTLQVGASLYDGLNPNATGGSDMRFVPAFRAEQQAFDTAHPDAEGNFELRLEWRMRDAAIAWALQNPGRSLELAVIKFWRMWSPWPHEAGLQSPWILVGCTITFLPLILMAGIGAWRFASRGYGYWICLVPAGYLTFLHLIFVSSIRYRQPPLLPLMVLAAGAIVVWWWGESERKSFDVADER